MGDASGGEGDLSNTFPYNSNNNDYKITSYYTAPFVDLYLEGPIDF